METEKEQWVIIEEILKKSPLKNDPADSPFLITDQNFILLSGSESIDPLVREFLLHQPENGKSFLSCFPTNTLEKFQQEFRKVLSGAAANLEIRNSENKSLYLELIPQFRESSEVQQILIRFRLHPERKSEEINSQLRAVLNNASIGIFLTRPQGDIVDCNDVARQMFGYELEDFIRLGREGLFASDGKMDTVLKARATTGKVAGELTALRKDGSSFPVQVFSSLFKGADGMDYASTVLIDITSSKEQELKLVEERNMLRSIIDNIPDYIFVKDKEHRSILSNHSFNSKILGTSNENAVGQAPENYFPEEQARAVKLDNERVLQTGVPIINRKDIIGTKDGEKQVVLLTKVPLLDAEGEIKGLVGIARNITESNNLEKEQRLIFKVIKFLNKSEDLRSGLRKTIKMLSRFFEFEAAEAWEIGYDKSATRKVAEYNADFWHHEEADAALSFQFGEGLPGSTWKSKTLQIWPQLSSDDRFTRQRSVQGGNLTGIGVPVIFKGEVVAVLTFFSKKETPENSKLSDTLLRIAYQISADIARKIAESRLNIMFQNSPTLIAVVGTDGYLKKVNPAFSQIFGYKEEELLQTPFLKFLHPEDKEKTVHLLESNAEMTQVSNFQNRCLTRNGQWKWISWRASQMVPEEGVLHLFGSDITPVKNKNLALKKFRNIIESSKDAIGLFHLDNEELYLNSAFQRISGYSEKELIGLEALKDLYADREKASEMFSTLLDGKYWEGDLRLKSRNGQILDYHLSAGPIFDEKKELIAIFGIHNDISERKLYQQELQDYAHRIKEILESITDGFYSLNENWEVTYWNKAAERMFNVSRERILGQNLWNFFPAQKKKQFFRKYQYALESGEKVFFEDFIELSGDWVEINIYPRAGGLSVFFKIITDRKRVEEEVRMANERYELLSKVTREAVYDWDVVQNVLEWSEAYSTVFGYDRSSKESSIEDWKKKVHPEDLERLLDDLHSSMASPEIKHWQGEYRMFRTNGEIADVLERGHIIRDDKGKAVRMIGAIQDITRLKENEKMLKQLNTDLKLRAEELLLLNNELEEFAYIASHDLQEPLRMVTAFLSQLQKKYEGELDDKARQYIHFAYDGAVRMRKIILDLLEYSRAGRNELKIEKTDLNDLMDHVTGMCKETIQEKKAVVKWKKLPVVSTSKTPLQQVIQNLLSNALKYSKTEVSPVINIEVEEKSTEWIFSITDNGIGIDPDFHEKIFVVFQRLHRKEEFSGTGIGLAICKKIVERLGGRIWLESQEGKGSTFYFSLQKQF